MSGGTSSVSVSVSVVFGLPSPSLGSGTLAFAGSDGGILSSENSALQAVPLPCTTSTISYMKEIYVRCSTKHKKKVLILFKVASASFSIKLLAHVSLLLQPVLVRTPPESSCHRRVPLVSSSGAVTKTNTFDLYQKRPFSEHLTICFTDVNSMGFETTVICFNWKNRSS